MRPDFDGPPMDPPPLPFQLQDPKRLARGAGDGRVEGASLSRRSPKATQPSKSGSELWDWIVWSNPIVEEVLGTLELSEGERAVIRQRLDRMVRERAGDGGSAVLANPVNIGIGTR